MRRYKILHAIGRIRIVANTSLVELNFVEPFFGNSSNTKDTEQNSNADILSICNSSMAAKSTKENWIKNVNNLNYYYYCIFSIFFFLVFIHVRGVSCQNSNSIFFTWKFLLSKLWGTHFYHYSNEKLICILNDKEKIIIDNLQVILMFWNSYDRITYM